MNEYLKFEKEHMQVSYGYQVNTSSAHYYGKNQKIKNSKFKTHQRLTFSFTSASLLLNIRNAVERYETVQTTHLQLHF